VVQHLPPEDGRLVTVPELRRASDAALAQGTSAGRMAG
jgi:hypothetical protein